MKRAMVLAAASMFLAVPTFAQTTSGGSVTSIPAQSISMSDWIRQSVYDNANNKIGDVSDVLLDGQGKANIAIVGVGGFLGIGEKSVAVPFDTIKRTIKDGKVHLAMDTSKDALKAAPGLRYDRVTNSWVPDTTPVSPPAATPGAPMPKPNVQQ